MPLAWMPLGSKLLQVHWMYRLLMVHLTCLWKAQRLSKATRAKRALKTKSATVVVQRDQTVPEIQVRFRAPILDLMSPLMRLYRRPKTLAPEALLKQAGAWVPVPQQEAAERTETPVRIFPSLLGEQLVPEV